MIYGQQVALRQAYLQKCVRATGVNHYEDCREDAVTLMRYLTYYNNVLSSVSVFMLLMRPFVD